MQNLISPGGKESILTGKLKCSLFYTDLTEQEIEEKNQFKIELN